MAIEKLLDDYEVSRRELATTDYRIIHEIERLLPRLKKLLDDNGVNTSDVDLTKMESKKRDDARVRIKVERARKAKRK